MSEETKEEAQVAPADQAEQEASPPLLFGTACEFEQRYAFALRLLDSAPKLQQGDRMYTTVASRLSIFRRAFGPKSQIQTEVQHVDNDVVRVCATIRVHVGHERLTVANGHAEEWREASAVNMTSALENAETSAIGRALAAFGLHGGEFASVNEVEGARSAQAESREEETVSILEPEEIAAAIASINGAASEEELATVYLKLNPALKIACKASYVTKKRSLKATSSAPASGSETAAAASPEAPSPERSASGQRRGRKPGGA